jgi:hypothetical protein
LSYLAPQIAVTKSFDFARIYYWRVQLIEPADPDDDRYVLLHGEDGETVGPLTVAAAQYWIDRFTRRPPARQHVDG